MTNALALPLIGAGIPANVKVVAGVQDCLKDIACALVAADVITAKHWKTKQLWGSAAETDSSVNAKLNLNQIIAAAITDRVSQLRPQPLAKLDIVLIDDTKANDMEHNPIYGVQEYNSRYQTHTNKVSVFMVRCHNAEAGPHYQVVGSMLQALEKHRAGLGHAVLHWLHQILEHSCRGLDPIEAYGWAQGNYWRGETDESGIEDEELDEARHWHDSEQAKLPVKDRVLFNEDSARDNLEIFRKAELEDGIPKWACTEHTHRKAIAPDQLARLRVPPRFRAVVQAAAAAGRLLKGAGHITQNNDISCFECCRWEINPFLLRWSDEDSMAQIWDDYMNAESEGGDTNMHCNAVFAFHDGPSCTRAWQRLETYVTRLVAAETLIRLLK